jgi:hypothetical protein
MGVDHGRPKIFVPQQLLFSADVIAVLEEVSQLLSLPAFLFRTQKPQPQT